MTCSRMSLHFPQWASISPPSCGFLLIPRIDLGFMVAVLLVRSQGVEGSDGALSLHISQIGNIGPSGLHQVGGLIGGCRGSTSITTPILLQDRESY